MLRLDFLARFYPNNQWSEASYKFTNVDCHKKGCMRACDLRNLYSSSLVGKVVLLLYLLECEPMPLI